MSEENIKISIAMSIGILIEKIIVVTCYKAKYRSSAFTKYFSFHEEKEKKKENCKLQNFLQQKLCKLNVRKVLAGPKRTKKKKLFLSSLMLEI